MHIPSYPKVYNLGHPALEALFDGPVVVQEKIDGSQFTFLRSKQDGNLYMRSKGAEVYEGTRDKLFQPAAATAAEAPVLLGHIYRCETLFKPHHNTLRYSRVPTGNLILFDVEDPDGHYFLPDELEEEAARLGIECVPTFFGGDRRCEGSTLQPHLARVVEDLLKQTSILGGELIEGVVVKNHSRWGRDGKFLAGKHVSDAFKETHKKEWKTTNPAQGDVIRTLVEELRSPARWAKAVQHLAERGELQNAPQDIGPLLREAQQDLSAEEAEYVKEQLFKWAWPKIARGSTAGLPQWYKSRLLERQTDAASYDAQQLAGRDDV